MAASSFPTAQYTSEGSVESSGAVLFDFSGAETKVCLLHHVDRREWLLAKGRRNCGESRIDAALREVREETGYSCQPYPVTMPTRAPPATAPAFVPDQPRTLGDVIEPFILTIRTLGPDTIKLIWWYIAQVDDGETVSETLGEEGLSASFVGCEEALQRLTFEDDRNVLRRAISLVKK